MRPGLLKGVASRLLAAALGVAALVAVEAVVREGGWAVAPAPAAPEAYDPDFRALPSTGLTSYLEPAPPGPDGRARVQTNREAARVGILLDLSFDAEPAPGVLRIFAFGGSATMGVPYERTPEVSFPSRLQHNLSAGGLDVEVINLGGASLGSRQVLEAAAEAVDYHPAALVVYSGNNEFFQYHLRLTQANPGLTLARGELERLHTYRLLRRALGKGDAAPAGRPDLEALKDRQDALVAEALRRALAAAPEGERPAEVGGRLTRRDRIYTEVVGGFEANLRALAGIKGDASLFIAAMPANLAVPPTVSLEDPGLGEVAHLRLLAAMDEGRAAFKEKDWAQAEAAFTQAIALDGTFAEAHYGLGRARLAQGDEAAALLDLEDALELDFDPGRPVRAIRLAPRALEAEGLAVAVDGLRALTPPRTFSEGPSPFVDRCHLSVAADDALAWAFAEAMLGHWAAHPP